MLRITKACSGGITTIKLEGKLAGPWVEELERMWLEVPSQPLAVDMQEVTAVDKSGKELLARMAGKGARLIADMPMTKYIIEQLSGQETGSKNGSKKG